MKQNKNSKHIHFIGIGGAGMSGIAEVLLHDGYQVSGSDKVTSDVTERLKNFGAKVFIGHHAENIQNIDVVVASTAIPQNNPEILAAKAKQIPVLKRAEMLAELMRFRRGIAVAGSHGKTTTTSLLTSIFIEANLDPTFVIGGKVNSAKVNGRLGQGEYLLAEADESDASFLHLYPQIAIVTSISPDHLVNYENDFSRLKKGFIQFLHNLPFNGLTVMCVDDENVRDIMPQVARTQVTYGFSALADIRALDLQQRAGKSSFTVKRKGRHDLQVRLNSAGQHNVQNALAAIAVASYLNIDDQAIVNALRSFQGVQRRFEVLGECHIADKKALLIDDYGHHPHEIELTIEAVRQAWPNRKITMVFQPHRYTRTRDCFVEFVRVLAVVDRLILLPIYEASEKPIENISSQNLYQILKDKVAQITYLSAKENFQASLVSMLQDGDVLLMQGAGDIGLLSQQLTKCLAIN